MIETMLEATREHLFAADLIDHYLQIGATRKEWEELRDWTMKEAKYLDVVMRLEHLDCDLFRHHVIAGASRILELAPHCGEDDVLGITIPI